MYAIFVFVDVYTMAMQFADDHEISFLAHFKYWNVVQIGWETNEQQIRDL